eukprot:2509550-Heterocapsa_arctica.AAC.1
MLHNERTDKAATHAHQDAALIYNNLQPFIAQSAESNSRAFPTTTSTSVSISNHPRDLMDTWIK